MTWEPPSELEEYRIVRPLGAGAMGRVFLAHDRLLDRPVAIKFVGSTEVGAAMRERFYVEARAVARLSHPNIIAIHRVGEIKRRPYLVSEYVRGTSLDAIDKPMPWERVLAIALDIAQGLASAHRRGVLHRDIKPANVILGEDDRAKLLDFGLAKLLGEQVPHIESKIELPRGAIDRTTSVVDRIASPSVPADATPARVTALVGTPLYLAPELWRGEPATPQSDVFALGVLLHELLTGRAPNADCAIEDLPARANAATPPISSVTDVPPRLGEVIDACLALDPSARPDSGDAVCERLELARAPIGELSTSNPYRGLDAFHAEHRALFFGRALEVRAVLERLRTKPLLIIVGDSGAGKSSLCRAGVIPEILGGALGVGEAWRAITIVPDVRPHERLREIPLDDTWTILMIDQLEEMLTVADPDEARAAGEWIVAATQHPRMRILATLRADFLGRLASLLRFEHLDSALFILGPLSERGMREAIVGPARAHGIEIDKATIDTLVASGNHLPLLQFTLSELWETRDDETRRIPAGALTLIGGAAGALARHADRVMLGLVDTDRDLAWRILVRLMTGEGTRAVVELAQLVEIVGPAAERIVERLVAARLLTMSADRTETVEVVHEVLFTGWPRLVEWRRTHERDARLRDQLAEAARQWQDRGRSRGLLWRGDALIEYRLWHKRWTEPSTELENAFATASESEARRARRLRTTLVVAVIAALAIVALVLVNASNSARAGREEAERQKRALLFGQGIEELAAGKPKRALPYLEELVREGGRSPSVELLIADATREVERDLTVIAQAPQGALAIAWSLDRTRLAFLERGTRVRAFSRCGPTCFTPILDDSVKSVDLFAPVFSPDTRYLAATDEADGHLWNLATLQRYELVDPARRISNRREVVLFAFDLTSEHVVRVTKSGHIQTWATATGEQLQSIAAGELRCAAFDGTRVVTATKEHEISVWSAVDGTRLDRFVAAPVRPEGNPDLACALLFEGDRVIHASGNTITIWEKLGAPARRIEHDDATAQLEMSPDHRYLLEYSSTAARVWELASSRLIRTWSQPAQIIRSAHFDPTSTRLAVATSDNFYRVVSIASGAVLARIEANERAGSARSSPPGAFEILFGNGDEVALRSGVDLRLHSLSASPQLARVPIGFDAVAARYSPDELWVALGGFIHSQIMSVDGATKVSLDTGPGIQWDVLWLANGEQVLVVGENGSAKIFDRRGTLVRELVGHRKTINRCAGRPSGTQVATASTDNTVRIWDPATGATLHVFVLPSAALGVTWSPDGAKIATAEYDGTVRIWDAETLLPLDVLPDTTNQLLDLAWSHDGERIATAGQTGLVTVWTLANRTKLSLLGHEGPVTSIAWSRDGFVATGSEWGGVRIWDPVFGRELVRRGPQESGYFMVEWSKDGSRLIAPGMEGTLFVWDVHRDTRSDAQLSAFLDEHVEFAIVDGRRISK